MMKYLGAILVALLCGGFAHAQMADPNKLIYDDSDNPTNWCRNGLFPAMEMNYQLGKTIRRSNLLTDYEDACPNADPAKCAVDGRVKGGVNLLVARKLGDFYCVFNPRNQDAGWLAAKDLHLTQPKDAKESDWLGKWTTGINDIEITKVAEGLEVSGEAQWFGLTNQDGEQVVHEGALWFTAKPVNNRLVLRVASDYQCAAELIHLGRFLVVRDNSYCGGANVRFNGVYRRK